MKAVTFEEFNRAYQRVVRDVYAFWSPAMQARLAENCAGWAPGAYDFRSYLERSSNRFYRAYKSIVELAPGPRVCDVGGFWGVLAVTLKELGLEASMTEALRYYGDAFSPLFEAISARGVRVIDLDPFEPGAGLDERFDAVTVMAVLEHYPHSHKEFLGNASRLLAGDGLLYLEVPNIVYWPKRLAFLRGRSPLVDARMVFRSAVPFVGHHHEFTMDELKGIAELSGLEVLREEYYNYSLVSMGWKRQLLSPLETLAFALVPSTRECLSVACRRTASAGAAR
jgi:2-polyprenyl-3-methyl-5-hydroxy-6-metoxy-1,4-benzoquinol methylase